MSSLSPRGSHASRCVSGCAVSRVARDGSLQEPVSRRLDGRQLWAPSAHGERRRPGAPVQQTMKAARGRRGQNAEPTTSARTKPGPSAMAVSNRCRRRVLPRRASFVCGTGASGRRRWELARLSGETRIYIDAMQSISTSEFPGIPPAAAIVVLTGGSAPKRPRYASFMPA